MSEDRIKRAVRSGSLRELLMAVFEERCEHTMFSDRGFIVEQLALVLDEAIERLCEEAADAMPLFSNDTNKAILMEVLHETFVESFARKVPTNAKQPPRETLDAFKKLFHYSWRDIRYAYDKLTDTEKLCVTRAQFDAIVKWIGEER